MPYTANKTKLFYSFDGNDETEILFLMEVPELGGAPEKIDVTTLSDSAKKYIPGIKDYGDLVFKFLYENENAQSNYRVLKALDDNGATASFKLLYPDSTAHVFDAIPSVKIDAGAINGALTFSATMLLQSDIATINPDDDNSDSENIDENSEA
jgi:hypothetical protein